MTMRRASYLYHVNIEGRMDGKMDYSIWILQKHGLSTHNITTISEQIISIFDLVINEKKEKIIRKTNRKHAIEKALEVIEDSPDFLNLNLIENPYILTGFKAPFNGLDKLIKSHNLTSISQLDAMSIEELDEKMFPSMRSTIVKIKQSVDAFYEAGKDKEKYLKTIILNNLFKEKNITVNKLADATMLLPEKYFDKFNISIEDMFSIFKKLINDGYISKNLNTYYFPTNYFYVSEHDQIREEKTIKLENEIKVVNLLDYLESDFKDKDILLQRLKGYTLEEIGKQYDVSRERIRQRQAEVLQKAPDIYEVTKYKNIFEEYSFSKDEFTAIFKEDSKIYEFLSIVLKKGKKDTGEFILNSDKILGSDKEKYLKKHMYFLTRFGEFKRINKQEFLEEVLFKYKNKVFDSDSFAEIYNAEAKKYSHLNLEVSSSRALEAISNRSLFAINTYGRKLRYYDMTTSTDDELLSEIINTLDDGCYSMRKIINDNKELMIQLDIRDEYELHNYYKKRSDLLNNEIAMTRSPEFNVGNYDKKKFIEEYIIEFTEQKVKNLIDYLYTEYGFRKNTMASYIMSNFKEYVQDDRLIYIKYDSQQYREIDLTNLIYKPIYLKSEVMNKLKKINMKLNTVMLSRLGYYLTGNIIFKKKFGNVTRALSSIIESGDIYRRGTNLLEQSNEMSAHLANLERNRELVVLDENIYASTSFLEMKGISLEMLESYIKSIYHFLPKQEYFSLYSLESKEFKHTLIDLGFETIFYERLITTSNLFNPVTRSSPVLFAKGIETPVSLSKFFSYELEYYSNGIDIYDLRDSIKGKYNIEFDIYDIQDRCQQAGAYYSKEMEKIYTSKTIYLDEVYS